jgi:hypothetical protein
MTVLGTVMQLVASVVLTLIPRAVLKKHGMRVPVIFSFLAIFSLMFAAGILLGFIMTFVLYGFFWWMAYTGQAEAGARRILFIVTFVLVGLYLPASMVALLIRLAAGRSNLIIASNVSAIFMALAMLSGLVEWLILKKKRGSDTQGTGQLEYQSTD